MTRVPKRILLVYSSLLLNETIKKAINKHENLIVIAETKHPEQIPEFIVKDDPDWVVMIKRREDALPQNIIKLINHSEKLKLLTFATDGSEVELVKSHKGPQPLPIENLNQLTNILASAN